MTVEEIEKAVQHTPTRTDLVYGRECWPPDFLVAIDTRHRVRRVGQESQTGAEDVEDSVFALVRVTVERRMRQAGAKR